MSIVAVHGGCDVQGLPIVMTISDAVQFYVNPRRCLELVSVLMVFIELFDESLSWGFRSTSR